MCGHYRYIFQLCHYTIRYVFGVGVSCRNLYSFVVYLYVNGSGSITSVREVCCCLPVIMWFLFGEVLVHGPGGLTMHPPKGSLGMV